MSSDLRLIRLCRKTNGQGSKNIEDVQQYLSTDYFDVMYCIEKDFAEDFTTIMGIESDFNQREDEIAVQTYALFCCQDIIDKYQERKGYGDPFLETDNSTIYLSVMQIHVAPEFVTRYYGTKFEKSTDLIGKIEEDIHEALNEFVKKCEEAMQNTICYRVYRLLSTGDFAVVIRSAEADTSFAVSSVLRKRYVLEKDDSQKKLVIYKTYTLLTMSENVVSVELDGSSEKGNQFVVRCCYSKKYWSEKSEVEGTLSEHNISPQIYNLPGRYDFCIYLSEQEFKQIFQYLLIYKNMLGRDKLNKDIKISDANYSQTTRYMVYLLENQYLSYVNERYLIRDKLEITDESVCEVDQKSIFEEVPAKEFLERRNAALFGNIYKKYSKLLKDVSVRAANRKSLIHYMELLGKLLLQCQTINNLSDTRTYASVLLKYIGILLDSLNAYYYYILQNKEDETDVLDLMEGYLKEAVSALDIYSQYIRNNNLQSLQTPNYNIESNTSMEKLLIAFSEIVYTCINDYSNCIAVKQEGLELEQKKYHPIIVPDLRSNTMGIEMMFPEWNIYKTNSSGSAEKDYLMIISCPTLKELGNVSVSIAALYHEAAHHLRYEKRNVRNQNVLQYSLACFSETLAGKLVQNHTNSQNSNLVEGDLLLIVRNALFQSIWDYLQWIPEGKETLEKAPLTYLEEYIVKQMEDLLFGEYYEVDICLCANQFLRKILNWVDESDENIRKILNNFDEKLDVLVNLGYQKLDASYITYQDAKNKVWGKSFSEVLEAAKELFVAAGAEIVEDKNQWYEYWKDVKTTKKGFYNLLWDKIDSEKIECFEILEEKQISVRDLKSFFYEFCHKLDEYRQCYDELLKIHNRSVFMGKLYKACYEKWKENSNCLEAKGRDLNKIQVINEFARYYGIDYETDNNKSVFLQLVKDVLTSSKEYGLTRIRFDIASYREITADIFMCILMKLNPLGYINVIVQKIRIDNEVPEEYVQRMTHAIVAVWCDLNSSDFKDLFFSFQEICQQLFEGVVKYVEMKKVKNYSWEEKICKLNREVIEESVEELYVQITRFQTVLESFTDEKLELRDALIMTKIVDSLVLRGYWYLLSLYNENDKYRGILKSDYLQGKRFLEKVRDKFTNTDKRFVKESIISYLNEPWIQYDTGKKEKVNQETAELLLEMYYENKCRSCLEGEWGIDGRKDCE